MAPYTTIGYTRTCTSRAFSGLLIGRLLYSVDFRHAFRRYGQSFISSSHKAPSYFSMLLN